jgi:hypothetical protein
MVSGPTKRAPRATHKVVWPIRLHFSVLLGARRIDLKNGDFGGPEVKDVFLTLPLPLGVSSELALVKRVWSLCTRSIRGFYPTHRKTKSHFIHD